MKHPPLSLVLQLIWQITLYSRMPQRYFLHLAEKEQVSTSLAGKCFRFVCLFVCVFVCFVCLFFR